MSRTSTVRPGSKMLIEECFDHREKSFSSQPVAFASLDVESCVHARSLQGGGERPGLRHRDGRVLSTVNDEKGGIVFRRIMGRTGRDGGLLVSRERSADKCFDGRSNIG